MPLLQHSSRPWPAALALALLAGAVAAETPPGTGAGAAGQSTTAADACAPVGRWRVPGAGGPRDTSAEAVISRALQSRVVLLGETHDSEEHHRWQLQTLAALQARHPELVIALEMLPRRAQPALDRWVAGELDEATFLREAEWREFWGFDPALYLPILNFARMNRIPLVAVNVDRSLTRTVAEKGFAAVPVGDREGIGVPLPALPAYEDTLFKSWREHPPPDEAHGSLDRDHPDFRRFVEAQLVWDRAIAQGLAEAVARHPGAVVAGLLGSGHVVHGWGVPHQLAALGGPAPLTLLPFDRDDPCEQLAGETAHAVFGVASPPVIMRRMRPRLGVSLGPADGGVRIIEVSPDSLALRTGLREGDVIVAVAGTPVTRAAEVAAAVMRQPPGTWLPLEVRRAGRRLELVARFPAAPER